MTHAPDCECGLGVIADYSEATPWYLKLVAYPVTGDAAFWMPISVMKSISRLREEHWPMALLDKGDPGCYRNYKSGRTEP